MVAAGMMLNAMVPKTIMVIPSTRNHPHLRRRSSRSKSNIVVVICPPHASFRRLITGAWHPNGSAVRPLVKPRSEYPLRPGAPADQMDPDTRGKPRPAPVRPPHSHPKEDRRQALWRAVPQADPKRCLLPPPTREYRLPGARPPPETGPDQVLRAVPGRA